VVAVRNYGLGREDAGDTVKRLFGKIGSAGGHRNMAKAVVPLAGWRKWQGSGRDKVIQLRMVELFSAVMRSNDEAKDREASVRS
jgi:hypothetical protein